VINAVLLKPLNYPDAERIVYFFVQTPTGPSYGASATKFNVLRKNAGALQDVAAYEFNGAQLNLTGSANAEQVHGIRVSSRYFQLFGAPVIQGRTFRDNEDQPAGGRVAILSYGLWQRRFGGEPQLVGKAISLSGAPYTVVGILGAKFDAGLDTPPDVFLPFQLDANSTDNAQYFTVVARLGRGETISQANAQLEAASNEFRDRFPNIMGPHDAFAVQPLFDSIVSDVRPMLLVLAGAVSFVLLIAWANVANLLLARASGRKREIAIRTAIGAGRGRIVRQLLIESTVLSVTGGALGLCLGLIGVRALLAINPGNIPRIGTNGSAVSLDWRLAVFTAGLSFLTGLLFGLVPALDVSRIEITPMLRASGGRSGTAMRQNKTRSMLVIGEVALAVILLIGATLLIRTFVALRSVNPGFDVHNVLTMRMSLVGSPFQRTSHMTQLIRDATQRLEAIPGVARAAVSYTLPLEGTFGVPFNIVGRAPSSGRYDGRGWVGVSPGYFDAFRIPILRGRLFNERDDAAAGRVAIINQTMARRFWPQGDPLQDRVLLGAGYGPEFEEPARQIIGVAGDVHDFGLNRDPVPVVYVPLAQVTDGITALASRAASLVWIVRTQVELHSVAVPVENELRKATGGLPVANVMSMDEVRSRSTAQTDFNMALLAIFGAAALLLAAIGIYGLMAYSVRQRTQELGIRMALGASGSQVRNLIVWQGMQLGAAGVALGLLASRGLTRLIASLLFGVKTSDTLVFTVVPVALIAWLWSQFGCRRAERRASIQLRRCELSSSMKRSCH